MKIIIYFFLFFIFSFYSAPLYTETITIPVIVWKKSVIYDEIIAGLQYYSKIDASHNFKFDYFVLNESRPKALALYKKYNSNTYPAAIFIGTGIAELLIGSKEFTPSTNLIFAGTSNISSVPKYETALTKNKKRIFFLHYFKDIKTKILLFETLFHEIKKIGVLYNPFNEASFFELSDIKKYCSEKSILLSEFPTPAKQPQKDFIAALKNYSKKIKNIDLLIIPSNTEITLNLDLIIGDNFKIPTLCYQKEGLFKNGIISLWPNLFNQGRIIYEKLIEIKKLQAMSFQDDFQNKFKIFINFRQMSAIGLKINVKYITWLKAVKK